MLRSRVPGFARLSALVLGLFALCLGLVTYGCGGDSAVFSTAPGSSNPPPPTTATLVFDFEDEAARTVPAAVTRYSFTGYDEQGNLVFGPVTRDRSPRIVLEDVPVEVSSIRVEYLAGAELIGLFASAVDLVPGNPQTFTRPDFEDLPPASLDIEVTPANGTVAAGLATDFHAVAVFTGGFRQVLDGEVVWSTGDAQVAVVSNEAATRGIVTGQAAGQTTVSATYAGVAGSANLTVTDAILQSLSVTPANPTVPAGRTQQFVATGTFSDASTADITEQVTWTSSNAGRVTISNVAGTRGLATGVSAGTANVTATHAGTGVTGSTGITVSAAELVSLAVTPANATLPKGRTQQFTATGTFSDSSTRDLTAQVNWTSSADATASVSNLAGSRGLASAHAVGTVTLTATDPQSSIAGSTGLEVTPAVLASIVVEPANPTVPLGRTQQFTATGVFSDSSTQDLTTTVVWSSSVEARATVSNTPGTQGLATTAATGTTTITATSGEVSGSTVLTVSAAELVSLEVAPLAPSVPKGRAQQFTATGTFSDSTTRPVTDEVTWSSSTESVATVSNAAGTRGLASTGGVGQTTITAQAPGTQISASTTLDVTAAVLDSLAITPVNQSVALGIDVDYQATGTYSDGTTQDLTTQVTWASSVEAVATISNVDGSRGVAETHAQGVTNISAVEPNSGKTAQTGLTVTPAALESLVVTPANPSVAKGRTLQFMATGTFTDGTQSDLTASVTWSSSSTATATITVGGGLATAAAVGSTTIRAIHAPSAVEGSTTLTVSPAVLESVAVAPNPVSVAKGRTQQFTATGTFSDGTTSDLTGQATWSSDNDAVAAVSNTAGTKGRATAQSVGTATLTALDPDTGISGTATMNVTAAVLESIAVTPANSSVVLGGTVQFTATGTFSDSSMSDLTGSVTWSTSVPATAEISNAAGTRGLATSKAVGQVTISALDPGTNVSGSTNLTVTAPKLTVVLENKCLDGTADLSGAVGLNVVFTNQDDFSTRIKPLDANLQAQFDSTEITPGVVWEVKIVTPGAAACNSSEIRLGCWDGTVANWRGTNPGDVKLRINCPKTCLVPPDPPVDPGDLGWGNADCGQ